MHRYLTAGFALAILAACPAAATAQSPSVSLGLDPNLVGRGSHLIADVRPAGASSSAEQPRSIALAAVRGFRFDPRARGGRCTPTEANEQACPASAKIGAGSVQGRASGVLVPNGSQSFTASVEIFLARAFRGGDMAGVVLQVREPSSGAKSSIRGRVVRLPEGPYGLELRFEDFGSSASPFPGVTVTIDRIQLRAGASRVVRVRRTVRRGGRRVRVTRRVRYHLLRNPSTCSGSWAYRLSVSYTGRDESQTGFAPCRRR